MLFLLLLQQNSALFFSVFYNFLSLDVFEIGMVAEGVPLKYTHTQIFFSSFFLTNLGLGSWLEFRTSNCILLSYENWE